MIILIDTEDKVIEVEGIENEKQAKQLLRDALKNFSEYEYVQVPPMKVNFIPLDKTMDLKDLLIKLIGNPNVDIQSDDKPRPPRI